MDGATLLLTGNCETVYGLCAIDLKRDGPVVIEAPAMLLGGISDLWQREIMGIGPTGRDQGQGGKFLLLPPDHDGAVPDGYMAAKSQTYGVVFGVRGFQAHGGGTAPAVALLKTHQDLSVDRRRPTPPANVFVNGSGQEIDTIFSDTGQYFADLAWLIEREPHETIPSHERFQLAAIGIEKGKPFAPDAARKALLDEAARFAAAIARTNSFDSDDPARLVYPDRRVGVGVHRRVGDLGLAGLRQHRSPRQLRLHRHRHVAGDGREARRHRIAVSVDATRRERRVPRRRQTLSPARPSRTSR